MIVHGKGKRLTIYIGESDRWEGRPLYMALLETLRREGVAGATVYRGVAGYGAHSRIHTTALLRLSADLPLIIEVVDIPERIEQVLPIIGPMIREGLITLEDVEILKYTHREIPPLPRDKHVRDIMTASPVAVKPDTPLPEVVRLLIDRGVKAVPVVDDARRVVGIITGGDLLRRGHLDLRLSLQRHLSINELQQRLRGLATQARTAADVMTRSPLTLPADASLEEAGRLMVRRGVKRVPVVDEAGRLIGIVSRYDVLRTLAADVRVGAPLEPETTARPRTAGDIADPNVPAVAPDAPLDVVLRHLLSSPYRRVVVTDGQGHLMGLITDAALLAQATPEERPGLIQTLAERLQHRHTPIKLADTAAQVMLTDVYTVPASAPLAEVLQAFVRHGVKRLIVVDEEHRPVGIVDRRHLLRILMAGEEQQDDTPASS